MTFIGDLHGAFKYYEDLIKNMHGPSIQVGDMGLGFPEMSYPETFPSQHKFIRGNHDNPAVCRTHPNYLGEFGYDPQSGIFYVSGARSLDRDQRIMGVDLWEDEELSYPTFQMEVIPLYEKIKPSIVVSHVCPESVKLSGLNNSSLTEKALQIMFEIYQPNYWIYGHYHKSLDTRNNGTIFKCLNSLEIYEVLT